MVVYEVTVTVDGSIRDRYEAYMQNEHIPDLLKTGKFKRASFERSEPGRFRIRYTAATREELDRYFTEDAARLREDFASRFPEGIEVEREEWTVLATFA